MRSRLIAHEDASVEDLARNVIIVLSDRVRFNLADAGGLVLASCSPGDIQRTAESIAHKLGIGGEIRGVDVACSGFTAGTELARDISLSSDKSVVLATSEITSRMINWEKPSGSVFLTDDARARGKAAKIFGDGTAAVLVKSGSQSRDFDILDAFAVDMEDPDNLLTLSPVDGAMNIDGSFREGKSPCINMVGRAGAKLMKLAPAAMTDAIRMSMQRALRYGTLAPSEALRHVVHHQANGGMVRDMEDRLKTMHHKDVCVWDAIADQGNISAASIPAALSHIQDRILPREIIAMPSVGAGSPSFRDGWLTKGCVLARKTETRMGQ
ncbi:hypothetical protein FJZ28_02520 [Candidatus Peregrinibacteria bacterium]|nr:hypothetical protein [Candidatus Peregrinibacteria bacterium]